MWVGCVVSISGANMDIFTIVSIICTVIEREKINQGSSIGIKKEDNGSYLKMAKGCNFWSRKLVVCLPSIA
jgi:hypothetical protein